VPGNLTEKGTDYTLNGEELIFDSVEGEYWRYEYDFLNRMTAVYKSESGIENIQLVAEYTYDADNYRVKKDSVEEGVTYFVFGLNGEVLYEENGDDYTGYVFVMGKHFAFTGGRVSGDGSERKTYFYGLDHLGTTVMITDCDGLVVWQDEAKPFGEMSGELGEERFTLKYTGKDMDAEIKLYYLKPRWYDAAVGRFMSEDPVKVGSN
jgi:RHS repeat-associated protein